MSKAYALPHDDYFTEDVDEIVESFLESCDLDIEFPYDLELREGEFSPKPASHYINPAVIIEYMREEAGERCGEVADGWLSGLSRSIEADLLANLDRWASRWGLHPRFYSIDRYSKAYITILNWDGDWEWKEEA